LTKTKILILLAAVLALVACSTPAPPPPAVTPMGEDRFLIDPRTGYDGPTTPQLDQRFEAAWRYIMAGNDTEGRRRVAELRLKNPEYQPALLAEAAMDIRAGNLDAAGVVIADARQRSPEWLAARVYEAEIAFRGNNIRTAYDLYRDLATRPDAPTFASERANTLQTKLFNDLVTAALAAPDAEAVGLLRDALAFNPGAMDARVSLSTRLVNLGRFDEARRELDPVLNTAEVDRPAVQEILAEIDVGRGRYQEAIIRYERLARRMKEPRYTERLNTIKEQWSMANMPPEFRRALESTAITRADLAVLLYWTVPSVRFARNLGSPPIATDLENVAGREEIIRAIAIGLYDVDPVTRRVSPSRNVTASRLSAHLARVLTLRGASCARGIASDRVLAACGVTDPGNTDATISGREAAKALEQVAKALQ
jgi:tetratricopeptide (TPR) repeat protein